MADVRKTQEQTFQVQAAPPSQVGGHILVYLTFLISRFYFYKMATDFTGVLLEDHDIM